MPSPADDRSASMTRAERQRQTRDALVQAARVVFARDGYHSATLAGIAREAGFSKGAVYSNFAGKADLFLDVLDWSLDGVDVEAWDPLETREEKEELAAVAVVGFDDPPTDLQVARGLGLATLEFVASAGRDAELVEALRERIRTLVDAYARVAARRRGEGEYLDEAHLALLLAAFDQGYGLFALIGWPTLDEGVLPQGLRRLLRPLPAGERSEREGR